MDISEYLPMFLAESREHLQELNLAVVRIEESPDDPETVDAIFRVAHSLKGMSATMGFSGIAALTHKMEDVFELLRQRSGGLPRESIDVLLECLDALTDAVDAIDADGAESIDPAPLIARLTGLVRTPDDQAQTPEGGAEGSDDQAPAGVAEAIAAGARVVRIQTRLVEGAVMPSIRVYQALSALAQHGDALASVPHEDDLEGFTGAQYTIWIATEHEDDAVAATARDVMDVVDVTLAEVGADQAQAQAPAASEPSPEATPTADQVAEPRADIAESAPAKKREAAGRSKGSATVRVDAERLDQLMHYMGELVVHRTHVESLTSQSAVPGISQAMQDLTRTSQALQAMVMQVRMIPVEAVFLRFPRLVRDLSSKLAKQVELRLVGQDTELDRSVVDALGDPIVHLVRNSLDHGLESPQDRAAAGKPEAGVLEISARHAGGNIVITVRDDGRGIDPERVARKAVERGLITAEVAATIDSQRAAELLFVPGFSTAEETSDVSGRGVGMDAVRTTIRELGGEVFLSSEQGKGTTAQIRLPLTLAIVSTLVVETDGLPFAVPLDRVERTLRLADHTVRSVAGQRMLVLRDGVLPIVDASQALGRDLTRGEAEHVVVVRGNDRRLALAVTRLIGQRELVTRPLPSATSGGAIAGGAVLSNGDITLIVDCDALAALAADDPTPIAAAV